MSSKLSQMRAQFREGLTITPSNKNSSVINKKVLDRNNNDINKTDSLFGTNASEELHNIRAPFIKKSIPRVSRSNANNTSLYSSKVTNEKIRTNPMNSRVSLNSANVQRLTNTTHKDYPKTDPKTYSFMKSAPKAYTSVTHKTSSISKPLPRKVEVKAESPNIFEKKRTVSLQSKSRISSPIKSTNKYQREALQRFNSEGTPCRFCGRYFALSERLQKHESFCKSPTTKTRDPFDSTEQRFKGQPKEYLAMYENSLKNPVIMEPKKSNWRTQHQYCIAAIREAKGEPFSGPSTSEITSSIQEACYYCKRRFNDDALKRHVPICAKLYHKKIMNF